MMNAWLARCHVLQGVRVGVAVLMAGLFLAGVGVHSAVGQDANGITGQRLKIATVERKPFVMKTTSGFRGFSIDLWDEIARELGATHEYVGTGSFPEMLELVRRGEADLAIANISITAAREEVMDFTHPIFDAGLQVMVPEKGGTLSILWAFLNWDMLVWLLGAGLFLLAIAHVMWFFERKSQPYFRVPYREGLWPSFWYSLHAVITGGFEENSPHTVPGRILGVFLVIASLFVGAAFVAKITSVLTVAELQSQIRSHKDLYGRKVGTTAGSTAAAFLRNNAIQHVTVDSVDELFNAVATKKIEAAVHDAPLLAYFAATEGRGRVRVVGPILRPEKFGIALREGSPLKEQINRTLLRMNEDGTYRRILNKWFGER